MTKLYKDCRRCNPTRNARVKVNASTISFGQPNKPSVCLKNQIRGGGRNFGPGEKWPTASIARRVWLPLCPAPAQSARQLHALQAPCATVFSFWTDLVEMSPCTPGAGTCRGEAGMDTVGHPLEQSQSPAALTQVGTPRSSWEPAHRSRCSPCRFRCPRNRMELPASGFPSPNQL